MQNEKEPAHIEVTPGMIARASRRIAILRHVYFRSFYLFLMIAIAAFVAWCFFHYSFTKSPGFFLLLFSLASCKTAGHIAQSILWQFRCPRCDIKPTIEAKTGLPEPLCQHCGLKLE